MTNTKQYRFPTATIVIVHGKELSPAQAFAVDDLIRATHPQHVKAYICDASMTGLSRIQKEMMEEGFTEIEASQKHLAVRSFIIHNGEDHFAMAEFTKEEMVEFVTQLAMVEAVKIMTENK